MRTTKLTASVMVVGLILLGASGLHAQDWPQWRGPNRDAKATGFTAPKTWPKELTKKWSVKVGDGVATPALVGDKLYVFARDKSKKEEILRCLDAATGKELWQDKQAQDFRATVDRDFEGPRCSPTVADGKVVTLGVNGNLTCFDAASGKVLWRKDDFKGSFPGFHTSSSPIIEGGLCFAQLGGERGVIVACDLATGTEKWKWTGDGTTYASPDLLTVGDLKVLVAGTKSRSDASVVAVNAADGKQLWKTSFVSRYNAASPMAEGQTLILSGADRGIRAVKVEKSADSVAVKDLWNNTGISTQFNTPVLTNNLIFGLSNNDELFCLDAATGKSVWPSNVKLRGGRRPGYGSIVDAGSVLMALTPATELVVYEPDGKEFKQLAKYKVGDSNTYAYPVLSGNRLFVKDDNSVTLWTIE